MGDQDPNFGCVSVSGPHCDGADSSERRNIEAMWRLRSGSWAGVSGPTLVSSTMDWLLSESTHLPSSPVAPS